jgi:D-threo-aldose 1-dehydrogenase
VELPEPAPGPVPGLAGAARLSFPAFGVGTSSIGGMFGPVDEAEALAVVRRAYECGIRMFDTAPSYGYGVAEARLGRALRDLPRGELIVSTKVGLLDAPLSLATKARRALRAAAAGDPGAVRALVSKVGRRLRRVAVRREAGGGGPSFAGYDFSFDGVMRSVERSLGRLGLERVDIVFIHDPDHHHDEALKGAYPALERLRSEGTIRAIGVAMTQPDMLAQFAREADFDVILVAGRYTLLDQSALADLLPVCLDRRIPVIAAGVFNSGILADPRPGASFDYAPAGDELVERALRLKAICDRPDEKPKRAPPAPRRALRSPWRDGTRTEHPAVSRSLRRLRSRRGSLFFAQRTHLR